MAVTEKRVSEERRPDPIQILRATEEWQRAGAYAVRIEGMNRQHHISLREEFDEHDGEGTRYIVLLDDGYPFGTCRFFASGEDRVSLGRVVILPEYRGKSFGRMALEEAERWIRECGFKEIRVDARTTAAGFYRKLGYEAVDGGLITSGPFECIRMRKQL